MAQVILDTVVLNLASDPTQLLTLQFVTQINPSPQVSGEDRQYGGTRWRSLSGGAAQKQQAIAAAAVEPLDVATLQLWAGVPRFYGDPAGRPLLVCYRDDSGEKFYGTIRSLQIARHQYDPNADVAFTVTQATYDETVGS